MTSRSVWIVVALLLLAGVLSGRELVVNGDFELDPGIGWQLDTWGNFVDTANCRLRWRHYWDGDRDFEVMIHKMLHQGMKLWQKVPLPTLDVDFSADCRLTSKTERDSLFAAACIGLEYIGADDSVLGETRVYSATRGCTWASTSTLHLVRVPDSLRWYPQRFNLSDELDSLPGVNRAAITAVRVYLLAYVLDNC